MKCRNNMLVTLCLLALLSACGQPAADPVNAPLSDSENNLAEQAAPAANEKSGDLIPDGVLVSTGSDNNLSYLDEIGTLQQQIETPGVSYINPDDVAIAGAVIPGGPFPPVVFRSWMPEQALAVNDNGSITTRRQTDTFLAMVAAPGAPAVAFSEVRINADNFPHGFLYAANPGNLDSVPAFFNLVDDPSYWALKPVGIRTVAGEAQGVWYVKTAWGIGGADLIFPMNRGLYFFDLTNGDNVQFLNDEHSLQGISPDLTFAAASRNTSTGSGSLTAVELTTGKEVAFALDPATDRGAGFAVFSPDNRYAAWLEASGSMISDPSDFQTRIRIGDTQTGGVVQALEDSDMLPLITDEMVSMMRPAGWLDDQTLLIEVRAENWQDATLLRLSLSDGSLTLFASGSFLAFGYQ